MTENTLAYARCSADTSLEEGLLLPPGWEVEVLANLSQVRGWGTALHVRGCEGLLLYMCVGVRAVLPYMCMGARWLLPRPC